MLVPQPTPLKTLTTGQTNVEARGALATVRIAAVFAVLGALGRLRPSRVLSAGTGAVLVPTRYPAAGAGAFPPSGVTARQPGCVMSPAQS
jgi:hypothetical protein